MTLEIKHLAGYLPYKLRIDASYYNDESTNELVISLEIDNVICDYGVSSLYRIVQEYAIEHIKPILRPTSDITKEIELNGTIVLLSRDLHLFDEDGYFGHMELDELKVTMQTETIKKLPYFFVQKLLEWHFDIHGLIEKGLAIDINTLEL